MLQLRGRRSIKGRKNPVRECLQAFPALFPLYSLLLFFFLPEFFSHALLSEHLEQATNNETVSPKNLRAGNIAKTCDVRG